MNRLIFLFLLLSFCGFGFAAQDNADNYPYPLSGFLPGDNGGFGFDEWIELETGNPGSMFTTSAIDDGSYSWGLSGSYALGRGLTEPLSSGSWSFLAQHDSSSANFSGFNLRSDASVDGGFADSELLRFGFAADQIGFDGTGVYVSTNAGLDYTFLDCGWIDGRDDVINYSIDWDSLDGSYSLSISNSTEGLSSLFAGSMNTAPEVAVLGVGSFDNSLNERLTFDAFEVSAIPEPVTWVLMFPVIFFIVRKYNMRINF